MEGSQLASDIVRFELFGKFKVACNGREVELPDYRYLTYLKLLLLSGQTHLHQKDIPGSPSEDQIRDIVDKANLDKVDGQGGRYGLLRETGLELRFRSGAGVYLKGEWTCDLVEFETIWRSRSATDLDTLEIALLTYADGIDRQLCSDPPAWLPKRIAKIEAKKEDIYREIAARRTQQSRHPSGLQEPVRPLLEIPLPTTNPDRREARRFHYGERVVPLTGREEELAQLTQFMDSPDSFRWWALVGGAGSGKSRLSLELMLSARGAGWDVGAWALDDHFARWLDWVPQQNNLVVVDYVVERFSAVQNQLRKLARTKFASTVKSKVRVLLLERNASDLWWQGLTAEDSVEDKSVLDSLHSRRPLELRALDLASITEIIATKSPGISESRREILARLFLTTIDRQGRPLFAAMFAEAYRDERDLASKSRWSELDLTRTILQKEVRRWRSAGVRDEDLNLLVMSTITGEIALKYLEGETLSKLVRDGLLTASWDDQKMEALATLGEEWNPFRPRMTAMQPDFLGEFFVLERLGGTLRLDAAHAPLPQQIAVDARNLLAACWRIADGASLAFQLRSLADHHQVAIDLGLDEPPAGVSASIFAYRNLLRAGKSFRRGFELLDRVEQECSNLDAAVYNVLIDKASSLAEAKLVVERMFKNGVMPTTYTLNSVVAKSASYAEMLEIAKTMESRGCAADVVTFNSLLEKAPQTEAPELLKEMVRREILPSVVTFNTLMTKSASFEEVTGFYQQMRSSGLTPTSVTLRILIQRSPDVAQARKFLKEAISKGIRVDAHTYNTLIGKGMFAEGLETLSDLLAKDIKPIPQTFNYLLSKTTSREEFELGLDIMKDHGFFPGSQIIIDYIAKASSLDAALPMTMQLARQGLGMQAQVVAALVAKANSLGEATQMLDEIGREYPDIAKIRAEPVVLAVLEKKAKQPTNRHGADE